MSYSTRALLRNYHGSGGKLQASYLSKILVLGEGLLLSLQTSVFLLSPHMAVSRETNQFSPVSSDKGINPIMRAPPSGPNYFLKAPSPNTITLGIRVPKYVFWGDTNMLSIPQNMQKTLKT